MKNNAIVAHFKDNVATVIQELKKGTTIKSNELSADTNLVTIQDIPCFHKIALTDIKKGEDVIKYGEVIGAALEEIKTGQHVHVYNVESKRGRGDKK